MTIVISVLWNQSKVETNYAPHISANNHKINLQNEEGVSDSLEMSIVICQCIQIHP